jgi:hypothetical protein
MSKGPWRKTKAFEAELKEAGRIIKREKDLTDLGYEPRNMASAALRNRAADIAEGPENEWVKVEVKVETAKVK